MNVVQTPQSRCLAAMAQADITPPVGIYHRMWGAALHDRATGVHKPLTATALWLEPLLGGDSQRHLVLGLDHCILEAKEINALRVAVCREIPLALSKVQICLSHTHGSGWLSRSRAQLPGGELIGPYLDEVAAKCASLAREARERAAEATIVYGYGRCNLARHRDFLDKASGQYVCGFNPHGPADDTLVVARVTSDEGHTLGTIVNYACHPTTLAWENTLISPDYIGALREVVERETLAPCLFLQGASGDLGPRDGFVGDTAVADRNGMQVGFAALSALASLSPPRTRMTYVGPVVSGATLGIWKHEPLSKEYIIRSAASRSVRPTIELAYRPDLPTRDATQKDLARWQAEEQAARAAGDEARVQEARARSERMTRQLARLESLPAGAGFPYEYRLLRIGDAIWAFLPGELYQLLQTTLRERFPDRAIVIATVSNGWQPGYIPAASAYGKGIYQETISPLAAGSLERLVEAVSSEIEAIIRE